MRFAASNPVPQNRLTVRPAKAAPKLVGIKTDLLIPGREEPFKYGAVILHEDKIEWVGTQSSIPAKYKSLEFTNVPVLMPGLWVYSSIAPLSMTAGHGDINDLPVGTVLDACAHGVPFAVCDGVSDCIKTVRLMIRGRR
jgi:hypothetical protein